MGSIYRRTNSPYLWVKYYANGRPVRESTGTTKEREAKDFLKKREGAVADGKPVAPRLDRLRYEEIADDLHRHYQTTGSRDLKEAAYREHHLRQFFRGARVLNIDGPAATKYVAHRQAQGAASGTIRRELGTLVRMLRYAYEHGKLLRLPVIHKPKEGSPRAGFFESNEYAAVVRHLAPDLQVAAAIAYESGWRTQSEVLTRERRHVDIEAGTLSLDAGEAKNDEARIVYLTPELKSLVAAQLGRVDTLQKKVGRIVPYLFPRLTGKRAGERRRDYRKAWATACLKAGLATVEVISEKPRKVKIRPLKIRHDLRRTAVRNMVNNGVVERVAMTVSGHKTRSVFDRYHIVSPADLKDVARKLAGTLPGTQAPSESKVVALSR